MDNRPVGIFDSGLGGLTCLAEFEKLLPGEDIVYFGDTARLPYGNRGREVLMRFARQDAAFLRQKNVKAVIIACGTVSSVAGEELKKNSDIPVFEVVGPAAAAAVEATRNGGIGIIGTAATVNSGKLEREVKKLLPGAHTVARACPLFVPVVEDGHIFADDPLVKLLVDDYLTTPIRTSGIDTLILGCTHYPLLTDAIDRFFGGSVRLINSGLEVAQAAVNHLVSRDMMNGTGGQGRAEFYVSDSPQNFSGVAKMFLGRDIAGDVRTVPLSEIEQAE